MQALGGAKNHMVVLPDADLDLAADQAVNAGFGSAGERCMAISAVRRGRRRRRRRWSTRSASVRRRCAPATAGAGCDMGPLVTSAARDRVTGYIDAGRGGRARTLVVDGRKVEADARR